MSLLLVYALELLVRVHLVLLNTKERVKTALKLIGCFLVTAERLAALGPILYSQAS